MTEVWLVVYDDGDYYCEGNHIAGVFATEAEAEAGMIEARDVKAPGWSTHWTFSKYPVTLGVIELP